MQRMGLEDTELFGSLEPARLAPLATQIRARPVRAGEYLYFDSQPAEYLWIVRAGFVRTLKASAAGRVTTLEQLRPGDPFGMAAIIGSATYSESAQAVVEGAVWRARRQLLADLIAKEPNFASELLALAARRLQGAHDRLCSFAHDSVPERLARAVLEQDKGDRIDLTRRALGESVGTTVETTIRVLRGFERAGWIVGGVGWIRTLDRKALERVAAGESGS